MIKYLYHYTKKENISSILKEGLKAKAFICLAENPNSWKGYADGLVRVNIQKFMEENPAIKITTWLPELDEICVWGNINSKYLQEIKSGVV